MRYETDGRKGLHDRSRRPKKSPLMTGPVVEKLVLLGSTQHGVRRVRPLFRVSDWLRERGLSSAQTEYSQAMTSAPNRKHTSRLYEDLDQKIDEGFQKVFSEWEANDLRIMRYRETEISDERAHDLIIRSVDMEAIPPSAIPRVLKEYREPWYEEFMPRTAWSLHNAFTETMKEKPHLIPKRSRILTGVFDEALGIA